MKVDLGHLDLYGFINQLREFEVNPRLTNRNRAKQLKVHTQTMKKCLFNVECLELSRVHRFSKRTKVV